MRIIKTHEITPESNFGATESLWIYNGLDCCVTYEVLQSLEPQLDNTTRATYEFSKSLQGPVLEMRLRGVRVDLAKRDNLIREMEKTIGRLSSQLTEILRDGVGFECNWRSPLQVKHLFYGILGLPEVKYKGKVTVNRDALEKLESHFLAQPIVSHILMLRDVAKRVGTLKSDVDSDGRLRTSYNIAGTTTGRFSSSLSDFGTGTNMQNWEERLREIVIADPGMKFAYVDLEQAESRLVGAIEWNLFHDDTYLKACESGDLHTAVARLAWPDRPWTGDLLRDRDIAESPFYRQHSFRHMAKVLGHGTNYRGSPFTMAKYTKIDKKVIAEFQTRYFGGFPSHVRWHTNVAQRLVEDGYLVSLTGRRRWFFGRRTDDSTVREAIAFDPQGSVGDILNQGMLNVWRANICQVLLQVHDAILIQYPEEQEDEILPKVLNLIQVPVELRYGRTLLIPSEASSGWNWSKWSKTNPDGLKKYKGPGADGRRREGSPTTRVLDQCFL